MNPTKRTIVLIAAVLASSGLASAQVIRTQDGRSIDANYRVGSGGLNRPVAPDRRFNSQLYVTGQVSGLAGFHGNLGYRAANELRLDLPSAALEGFHRRSVGLDQATGGQSYISRPYYSRTRTVFGLRGIAAGLAAPGTNVPLQSGAVPYAMRKLYDQATMDYKSLAGLGPGQALSSTLLIGPLDPRTDLKAKSPATDPTDKEPTRPVSGVLFGSRSQQDQLGLIRELRELDALDNRLDNRIKPERNKDRRKSEDKQDKPDPRTEKPTPGQEQGRKGFRELATQLPAANRDAFTDLLVGLGQARALGPDHQPGRTPRPDQPLPLLTPTGTPEAQAAPDTLGTGPLFPLQSVPKTAPKDLVEVSPDRQVIINSLAGSNKDRFNQYMTQAEEQLKIGRYYRAAGRYKLAIIVNRDNPLARLGLGLALFAGGEPLRAAFQVRKAMQLFPPVIQVELNVDAMVDKDVINQRIEQMARRLEDSQPPDDKLLLLLGAYMNHNLGQIDEAKRYAASLKKASESDALLNAYATFVLTGKLPQVQKDPKKVGAAAPTTQPAKAK